ncbi:MAG: right-handed parallel beta-helix repeat-containing protein [Chitinophagaceae bacterium]
MKKITIAVVKGLLVATQLFLFTTARSATYYFSSSAGDDSRNNQQASNPATPWQSLQKLHAIFSTLQPGDSILFKKDDLFYGFFEASASGTASAPIVISSYGNGRDPVISGFSRITDWIPAGFGVWETTLSNAPSTVRSVLLNDVPQAIGRFPNATASNSGYLNVEAVLSSNAVRGTQLPGSYDWSSADIVIRKTHWVLDRNKLTSVQGGSFTYNSESDYGATKNFGYFIQNHPAALDLQGEWYYNSLEHRMGILTGQPDMSSTNVDISSVDQLLGINAQSYLVFEGLIFKGANDIAININNASNIRMQNCSILYSGNTAIRANNSQNLTLENLVIDYSNNIACDINNTSDLIIKNNRISNTGTVAGSGKGDSGSYEALLLSGDNQLIEGNSITNTGYIPLTFNGNGILIKNNYISGFGFVKDDGGGIYTWNNSSNPPIHHDRTIDGNIVIDGLGAPDGTDDKKKFIHGIYMDDNADNVTIKNNTIAGCGQFGFYIHNSHHLLIDNNTTYNNLAQVAMIHDNIAPQYPVDNIVFTNNITVSKTAYQPVAIFRTIGTSLANMGTFDYNYYLRPLEDGSPIDASWSNGWGRYDLEAWQQFTGKEQHSRKSPLTIAPYKVNSVTGRNMYGNGSFNENAGSLYSFSAGGSSTSGWSGSGPLDGGSLKLNFTSQSGNRGHATIIIAIGSLVAGRTYLLKYEVAGVSNKYVETYLRKSQSPYNDLSERKYSRVNANRSYCEVLFTASGSEADAALGMDIEEQVNPVYIDNLQLNPVQVTMTNPDDMIRFVFNNSSSERTYPLNGNYVDAKGNSFSGSITLPPYQSAVLLLQTLYSLPLTFTSFKGTRLENTVRLEWDLSDNGPGLMQQVERSSDGKQFRKIGVVEALSKTGRASYSFIDKEPAKENYYRIRYLINKTSATVSKIILVKFPELKKATGQIELKVSPNPVMTNLTVSCTDPAFSQGVMTLISSAGNTVRSQVMGSPQAVVNVSSLANGMYVLTITNNNSVVSKRFKKG